MLLVHDRKLILEDGSEYTCKGFGYIGEKVLEVVFNTSMAGYQEIISDPSYTDQAVVMTYPLIGNYGINEDDYETDVPSIGALIVHEYNDYISNFRAKETLAETMKRFKIAGLTDIDTRHLTRKIRTKGSMRCLITDIETSLEDGLNKISNTRVPTDAVKRVTPKHGLDFNISKPKFKVVAIDCGMKRNIVRSLNKKGCDVIVMPCDTPSYEIEALMPDGIFVSNGPGDPKDNVDTIKTIRNLLGKYPMLGICLGHQMISLAYGATTYKLKFGHRGGNHPVKNLLTDTIEITSQNHSYAVDAESIKGTGLEITHINILDNTVEGVRNLKDKVFSVQYHPESAPGPEDSEYLFDQFIALMEGEQNA